MHGNSTDDTLAHLIAITERRDLLHLRATEALDALLCSVERERPDPARAVELWQAVRYLGVKGASERMAIATGYGFSHIVHWSQHGIPQPLGRVCAGHFPLEPYGNETPSRGVSVVYVLFAGTQAVYIGQSQNARARLKMHWKDAHKREAGIDRWWLMVCAPEERNALEARLILEHQPLLNVAGKGKKAA